MSTPFAVQPSASERAKNSEPRPTQLPRLPCSTFGSNTKPSSVLVTSRANPQCSNKSLLKTSPGAAPEALLSSVWASAAIRHSSLMLQLSCSADTCPASRESFNAARANESGGRSEEHTSELQSHSDL